MLVYDLELLTAGALYTKEDKKATNKSYSMLFEFHFVHKSTSIWIYMWINAKSAILR